VEWTRGKVAEDGAGLVEQVKGLDPNGTRFAQIVDHSGKIIAQSPNWHLRDAGSQSLQHDESGGWRAHYTDSQGNEWRSKESTSGGPRDSESSFADLRRLHATLSPNLAQKSLVVRGGVGSGNSGHVGRPGSRGGSGAGTGGAAPVKTGGPDVSATAPPAPPKPAPQVGPPEQGETRVGITNARPGVSEQQIVAGMNVFSAKLSALPNVSEVSVQAGVGGYMGGHEPTWIVSYKGDGDALKLCAQTAKDAGEDAALFIGTKGRGTDSVATDFQFDKPITPVERSTIEQALVTCGEKTGQMKGWQWFKDGSQHSVLRSICVPQWGGEANAHAQAATTMSSFFKSIGAGHSLHEYPVGVGVLEKEGPNAYDTVLNG
jgi:hypothetical protein